MKNDIKEFFLGTVAGILIAFGVGTVIIELLHFFSPIESSKFDFASLIIGIILTMLGIILYRYNKFTKNNKNISTDPDGGCIH